MFRRWNQLYIDSSIFSALILVCIDFDLTSHLRPERRNTVLLFEMDWQLLGNNKLNIENTCFETTYEQGNPSAISQRLSLWHPGGSSDHEIWHVKHCEKHSKPLIPLFHDSTLHWVFCTSSSLIETNLVDPFSKMIIVFYPLAEKSNSRPKRILCNYCKPKAWPAIPWICNTMT